MAATRGRRVALWAAGIAVAVLAAAGFALKDRIQEEWLRWKWERTDDGVRWRIAAEYAQVGDQQRRIVEDWCIGQIESPLPLPPDSAVELIQLLGEVGSIDSVALLRGIAECMDRTPPLGGFRYFPGSYGCNERVRQAGVVALKRIEAAHADRTR